MLEFILRDRALAGKILGEENVKYLIAVLHILSHYDAHEFSHLTLTGIIGIMCRRVEREITDMKKDNIPFPQLSIVEGNIGIGKTTLINKLCQSGEKRHVPEPLEIWQNISYGDVSCFEQFYREIEDEAPSSNRYVFMFEVISLVTKFLCISHCFLDEARQAHLEKRPCRDLLSERWFLTDRYFFIFSFFYYLCLNPFLFFLFPRFVFASNIKHKFSKAEYSHYNYFISLATEAFVYPNAKCIKLVPLSNPNTVDVCLSRIRARNRPGEEKITRRYLEDLEYWHTIYFKRMCLQYSLEQMSLDH